MAAESKIRALEAKLLDQQGAINNLNLSSSTDFGTGEYGEDVLGSALDVDLAMGSQVDSSPTSRPPLPPVQATYRPESSSSVAAPPQSDLSILSNQAQGQWAPLLAALRSTVSLRDDRLLRTITLIESLAKEMEELNARLLVGRENEDRLVRSHRVLRNVYEARIEGLKVKIEQLATAHDSAKTDAERARMEAERVKAEQLERERIERERLAVLGIAASVPAADLAAQELLVLSQQRETEAQLSALSLEKEQLAQRARDLEIALSAALQPTLVQGPSDLQQTHSQASGLGTSTSPPRDARALGVSVESTTPARSMAASVEEFGMDGEEGDLEYWRSQARLAERGVPFSPEMGKEVVRSPAVPGPVSSGENSGQASTETLAAQQLLPGPARAVPLADPEIGIREVAGGMKMLLVKNGKRTPSSVRMIPRGAEKPVLVWTKAGTFSSKEESGWFRFV
jgi:hypothetical protein